MADIMKAVLQKPEREVLLHSSYTSTFALPDRVHMNLVTGHLTAKEISRCGWTNP